jgi:hypothetical protein
MPANLGLGMRVSVPLQTQDSTVKFIPLNCRRLNSECGPGFSPATTAFHYSAFFTNNPAKFARYR